jgi:hypothetical protein
MSRKADKKNTSPLKKNKKPMEELTAVFLPITLAVALHWTRCSKAKKSGRGSHAFTIHKPFNRRGQDLCCNTKYISAEAYNETTGVKNEIFAHVRKIQHQHTK